MCKSFFSTVFIFILSCSVALSQECHLTKEGAMAMYGVPEPEKTLTALMPEKNISHEKTALKYALAEGFDGVNPFISVGKAPFFIKDYMYDSMMFRSPAEPFTLYPLLVKMVDLPEDRKSVTFEVMENAAFSDKSPVTPEDILFTFNLLKEKGRYNYQIAYKNITAEILDTKQIRFHINENNRELPLILGLMPVLSHKNKLVDFTKQSFKPLIGAGTYKIKTLNMGSKIVLERDMSYYGKNSPISCFRFHFDTVEVNFFRNEQAVFEMLRAGQSDFFYEQDISRLNRAYDFPKMQDGTYLYQKIRNRQPSGLFGFVFNTRRKPWDDVVLRRVVKSMFNFETLNRHYLYDSEVQIDSSFMGSSLAYYDNDYKKLKAFTGQRRELLTKAFEKLKAKGYSIHDDGLLYSPAHERVTLEIITRNPTEDGYALLLAQNLEDIGIKASIRTVDDAVYQKRLNHYDYDMIIDHRYNSLSPGTEQSNYWGCKGRTLPATRNYAGICNNDIQKALTELDQARNLEDLHNAVAQIDYRLMKNAYYIPLFAKLNQHIIAHKNIQVSSFGIDYFYPKNN